MTVEFNVAAFNVLYGTSRTNGSIRLGYTDLDFGRLVDAGIFDVEKGKVYKFELCETIGENVYSCEQDGKHLYSPLNTFLSSPDWIMYPDLDIISAVARSLREKGAKNEN